MGEIPGVNPTEADGKKEIPRFRTILITVFIVIVLVSASIGWVIFYRDSDGDGVANRNDAFPQDNSETSDRDHDGHGDNIDVFPDDATEWVDSDGDGHGDVSDAFPNDPGEWLDTDNDGHGDNIDRFPTDPNEWWDVDNDGIGDISDLDDDNDGTLDTEDLFPYENAKIRLILQKFILLDPVDGGWFEDSTYGNIWLEVNIVNSLIFRIPETGTYLCEVNSYWDIKSTIGGEEMVIDVPDDREEWMIEIRALDEDSGSDSDLLDLSPTQNRNLAFMFNMVTEQITGDVTMGVGDGSRDGTENEDDDDAKIEFTVERIF